MEVKNLLIMFGLTVTAQTAIIAQDVEKKSVRILLAMKIIFHKEI